MLTPEDLQQIAMLLEAYGLTKQPTKGALRTRRYREKQDQKSSQNVTAATSQNVTTQQQKRHKTSQTDIAKRHNGHDTEAVPVTRETWNAYSAAYHERYHTDPKWNASVGGMIKTFVGKLGAEEAPHVAAFYLTHNGHFYVREMHPIRIMVRDAEKLRTEWATNRTVTETQARQIDRTATLGNAIRELKEEIKNGPH